MITADANLLVRIVVLDDAAQTERARAELKAADAVVITLPALCEFCWVLRSRYRLSSAAIARAVASIAEADNVIVDSASVTAGVRMLEAGGDFADAVMAEQGERLGSRAFVSFDRDAVRRIREAGLAARQPVEMVA